MNSQPRTLAYAYLPPLRCSLCLCIWLLMVYPTIAQKGFEIDSLKHLLPRTKVYDQIRTLERIGTMLDLKGFQDSAKYYFDQAASYRFRCKGESCIMPLQDLAVSYDYLNLHDQADSIYAYCLTYEMPPDLFVKYYAKYIEMARLYRPHLNRDSLFAIAKAQLAAADDNGKYWYYFTLAGEYAAKGKQISAIQAFLIARSYLDEYTAESFQIDFRLGILYCDIQDYESSIQTIEKALKQPFFQKHSYAKLYCLYVLMEAYQSSREVEKLKKTCFEAIDIYKREELGVSIGYAYGSLGEAYLEEGKLDSAFYYINEGINISQARNEQSELSENYQSLSSYYVQTGNIELASTYIQASQKYQDPIFPELDRIKQRAEIEFELRQTDSAYVFMRKYALARDSLNQIKHNDYKSSVKLVHDNLILLQKKEVEVLRARNQQTQWLMLAGLGGTFILVLAFLLYKQRETNLLLYKSNTKVKEINQQLVDTNEELNTSNLKYREQNSYLENFASVAAHDLKAPVRVARSFAGVLHQTAKEKLSTEELQYLEYIHTNVLKFGEMIDDLLALSKLDQDLPPPQTVNLRSIVDELEMLFEAKLLTSQQIIVVPETIPLVVGHESLIRQLLQNIIANSIKYNQNEHPSEITLSYQIKDTWLEMAISDEAGGIPEYLLPKIFELFVSSDKYKGNGIGLATCKKIVQHYGGNIWVENKGGVGATFCFTLPLANLSDED